MEEWTPSDSPTPRFVWLFSMQAAADGPLIPVVGIVELGATEIGCGVLPLLADGDGAFGEHTVLAGVVAGFG